MSSTFSAVGSIFPQAIVPHVSIRQAMESIGGICVKKKVFGHVSVDFVAFPDTAKRLKVWAVDLDLAPSPAAFAYMMFDALAQGVWDQVTNLYYIPGTAGGGGRTTSASSRDIPDSSVARSFCASFMIHHPDLSLVKHASFFALCKDRGVALDIESRVGTAFYIIDSLLKVRSPS